MVFFPDDDQPVTPVRRLDAKPDPEVLHDLERFTADATYFDQHYQDFLKKYPERWVAVYDKHFVAAEEDLVTLIQDLRRKKVPASKVFVEYVTSAEVDLIL